jgi:site-specific DNA-methyltransferase (adenine-specific)
MNTDLMFSSKTDLRATPQAFFDKLDSEFHFTLDPCATRENAKCEKYFTEKED